MRAGSAPDLAIADPVRMRHAGCDLLSLALIDARNRTLRWLAAFDGVAVAPLPRFDPPLWLAAQAGAFQDAWIGRNTQRLRGPACPPAPTRLAAAAAWADEAFDATRSTRAERWAAALPSADDLRTWLADTLETTLELLESTPETDTGLYFHRLALLHEDRLAETLAALAQAADLPPERQQDLWPAVPARATRDAIWFPAQRWTLGSPPGGLVPDNERPEHDEAVPEFEIDAQPVNWQQYVEFVADSGYDEPRWWSAEGWDWIDAAERRAPRYVEQLGAAVLARRHGRTQRIGAAQAAMHVSWYEAEAWCRWAGRRLPTELEWELAAHAGATRGFVWGDVFEWTLGRARTWPGQVDGPARRDAVPPDGTARVLRGASFVSVPRLTHPKARRFAEPMRDELFCGFRSCAL
jgi:gamma-glutamyl hercynylcysteine S-oxide synthase